MRPYVLLTRAVSPFFFLSSTFSSKSSSFVVVRQCSPRRQVSSLRLASTPRFGVLRSSTSCNFSTTFSSAVVSSTISKVLKRRRANFTSVLSANCDRSIWTAARIDGVDRRILTVADSLTSNLAQRHISTSGGAIMATKSDSSESRDLGTCIANGGHCFDNNNAEFRPEKVLILTKLTRLEFERRTNPGLSEKELEQALRQRGSDYNRLLERHDVHKNYLTVMCSELTKRQIEHKVVQRWEYDKDAIDWADAIFTAGGDGTFLLGASKIRDHNKPIIGINTDPASSEGYLCLMKKLPDSHFPMALDRLFSGDFRWLWRQRLRVSLCGKNAFDDPIELHDQQLMYPEYRWSEHVREHEDSRLRSRSHLKTPRSSISGPSVGGANDSRDGGGGSSSSPASTPSILSSNSNPFSPMMLDTSSSAEDPSRVLPYLALNEVYIGESLSSRVSYYELQIDDQEKVKQKSSGLTVCTGTGSTSWYFNINKLTDHCVSDLLKMIKDELGPDVNLPTDDQEMIHRVSKKFNDKLIFCPSDLRMAYAIRDPVFNATYRPIPPRGFSTQRVEVKSRCFDAHLVIDGGMSYIFNDGAKATLEIRPEDALRTVIFR